MIVFNNVSKQFGAVTAVRRLNMEVIKGETLALVGPNGSGKTTSIKMAVGLVSPTGGSVTIGGMAVGPRCAETRRIVGYLPQRLTFPEGCTAREVMALYCALRGAPRASVAELLERTGLTLDADRHVDDFSGGMRQRLGLAIALLGNPEVLILDEPTSALDPSGALMVRDLIGEIAREGRTVLLSSHDLTEVERLANRVAIFAAGALLTLGSTAELYQTHQVPSLEQVYRNVTQARVAA